MSINDYLTKKRRNKIKKQLRLAKPYLMGARLEQEVDRIMGIADSGKMDWATIVESGKETSEFDTPESVLPHIEEVAKQFSLKQWVLYWFFKKRVLKLQSTGRKSSDYLALLKETATHVKPMDKSTKAQALVLFSNEVVEEPMTIDEALLAIDVEGL